MGKQHFKETIEKLVETFERNKEVYKDRNSDFNEAQLREQFLNPMFKALGWDMSNEEGYAEQYKEVVHEDKVYVKGKPKAPDYSFRIGGQRKFFLEAKQPFVKIKTDFDPAFQLRRYAWSAHLPISILTDFEEFAVYDTTIEPKTGDYASNGRIEYFTYDEYKDKWEQIYDLFAKESILKGSFDKYAAKEKRGKQVVDKVFLSELETWREWLAKDIARLNSDITAEEMNFAVQKLIDRIIFLRIAEDRGIEPYKALQQVISNSNSYSELVRYFKRAHEKYNSSLFDFTGDRITTALKVSDEVLDRILNQLYYPNSPYEFSVLGVELLGSIYEQFLGKVITLTNGHIAQVEDKPEVKKAGGVFYTPQYIVEYIVGNTVGELVKGKTPKEVEKLKVLDPACGSGSFLIGAYEYLLNWHLNYYTSLSDSDKSKLEKKGVIYKLESKDTITGNKTVSWHLTTEEKKKIMLNNIYGVDIDLQAVEVTKLSLALKMLENENQETISIQMNMFPDRILPDLSSNIKCGNSLVGSDYWQDKDLSEVTEAQIKKVNAFDWHIEFKDIIDAGGFDAVIGNPPYIKEYTSKEAFEFKYGKLGKYYQGKMDLWYVFTCFGLDLLAKNGLLGFIAPNNWITNSGASKMRTKIMSDAKIIKYVDFNEYQVFDTASIQTMVFILMNDNSGGSFEFRYTKLQQKQINVSLVGEVLKNIRSEIQYESFRTKLERKSKDKIINFISQDTLLVLGKIQTAQNNGLLNDEVATGIDVHQDFVNDKHLAIIKDSNIKKGDGIFILSEKERARLSLTKSEIEVIKPYYTSEELNKYYGDASNKYWVIYTDKERKNSIVKYPNIKSHLDKFKKVITSDFAPYGLHRARDEKFFLGEKIMSLRKTLKGQFTFTNFPCYVSQSYFVIKTDRINMKYLTGLLNSQLVYFWLYNKGKKQGEQLQVDKAPLLDIPLVYKENDLVTREIILLVDKQITLCKNIKYENNDSKKKLLQNQIDSNDLRINRFFYHLYGLTQEEIKVIESSV